MSQSKHSLGQLEEYLRANGYEGDGTPRANRNQPASQDTLLQQSQGNQPLQYPFQYLIPTQAYAPDLHTSPTPPAQDYAPDSQGCATQTLASPSFINSPQDANVTQAMKRKRKGRASSMAVGDNQPKSKRAIRRAKIKEEQGSVGASDVAKGVTRVENGVKQWWDPDEKEWRLAAPLDDYRHQIIAEDNAYDAYLFTPDSGVHEDDITTFPPGDDYLGQKYWNLKDKCSWGNIRDEEGNKVMYWVDRQERDIETPDTEFMMYGNVIMLDPDDHPIIDWPAIPRCFSSNLEAARIEALRRIHPWLSFPHFRARMPRTIYWKSGRPKDLFGLSSFSQRLARWREKDSCVPLRKHGRGTNLKEHIVARLAAQGLDQTSTEGLKPIPRKEVARLKKLQKGKFPENAGFYTLTEEEQAQVSARYAKHSREDMPDESEDDENASWAYETPPTYAGSKRRREESMEPDLEGSQPTTKGNRSRPISRPAPQPSSWVNVTPSSFTGNKRKREESMEPDLEDQQPVTKRLRSNAMSHPTPQLPPLRASSQLFSYAPTTPAFNAQETFDGTYSSPTGQQYVSSIDSTPAGEANEINFGDFVSVNDVSSGMGPDLRDIAPQTANERSAITFALSWTVADYLSMNQRLQESGEKVSESSGRTSQSWGS